MTVRKSRSPAGWGADTTQWMSGTTIGFLGAGKMATALAKGFLRAGLVKPSQLFASDVAKGAIDAFAAETGGTVSASNAATVAAADVLVLAVKPDQVGELLQQLGSALDPARHLIISIAAGVSLKTMSAGLGPSARLIRVMPNTPCLVGCGASAFSRGSLATDADAALVLKLLSNVGLAVEVSEKLLDAVTGLSGSGPAYVYQIIEALSDGGVRMGLPRETATKLAAQTVLGAAQMVLTTGQHPGPLKDAVTSPGGTTIAGLHELERGGLRGILMDAVEAATERARELDAS